MRCLYTPDCTERALGLFPSDAAEARPLSLIALCGEHARQSRGARTSAGSVEPTAYIMISAAPDLPDAVRAGVTEGEILSRAEATESMLGFGHGPGRGVAVATGQIFRHPIYGRVELYEAQPSNRRSPSSPRGARETTDLSMRDGLDRSGMTWGELHVRYTGLGGLASFDDLRDFVTGDGAPNRHQHNLIAHALNEYFTERGEDHSVGYVEAGSGT